MVLSAPYLVVFINFFIRDVSKLLPQPFPSLLPLPLPPPLRSRQKPLPRTNGNVIWRWILCARVSVSVCVRGLVLHLAYSLHIVQKQKTPKLQAKNT